VLIEQAKESLREQGVPFDADLPIGGMIEIPAAVLAMGAFLRKLDFLSIGTNDLIQYTLAVDRSDEAVSHLYDPLHPAIVRLLHLAISSAAKAKVPIAVCGEMAGEETLTRLLLGLGLRDFSMHPAHLLTVKQRVLQTEVQAGAPIVERMKRADDPVKLATLLEKLNV
jgi:phosphoenolpyruvate-protein phosphotransferase (PTS system enzyme I)